MPLIVSEVYDALRTILTEEQARRHAIVLSDWSASHAALAATFREIGAGDEPAERAAKALIECRKYTSVRIQQPGGISLMSKVRRIFRDRRNRSS